MVFLIPVEVGEVEVEAGRAVRGEGGRRQKRTWGGRGVCVWKRTREVCGWLGETAVEVDAWRDRERGRAGDDTISNRTSKVSRGSRSTLRESVSWQRHRYYYYYDCDPGRAKAEPEGNTGFVP